MSLVFFLYGWDGTIFLLPCATLFPLARPSVGSFFLIPFTFKCRFAFSFLKVSGSPLPPPGFSLFLSPFPDPDF